MYFTKVELHNFGIYKGTHTMSLENRTGNRNITLIGGLNGRGKTTLHGRGKTTLHDAILLGLYGKHALTYIQEKARSYDRFLLEHIPLCCQITRKILWNEGRPCILRRLNCIISAFTRVHIRCRWKTGRGIEI